MLGNVPIEQTMRVRLIGQADRLCVAGHMLAWSAAAISWAVSWWRYGPEPSGPLYSSAMRFISRMDILVRGNVEELTIRIGQSASAWLSVDLGGCFTVAFACLILLAGTLQWFLLGRLVQWVAVRKSRVIAVGILGTYGVWAAAVTFLWVAS
jgi:hypothetical protein